MSNFQRACELSCDRWLAMVPLTPEEHKFSEKHKKEMKKLFNKMRGNKYHHFTKASARAILVAAIILALTITALAVPSTRDYILKPFSDYTEYSAQSGSSGINIDAKNIAEVSAHYIPDGFSESYGGNNSCEYSDENGKWFNIQINSAMYFSNFDTEHYECKTVEKNGIKYILFSNGEDYNGVLCNKSNYYYIVDGNLNCDELLEIAENVY